MKRSLKNIHGVVVEIYVFLTTQAKVGGSPFGPFISVARGHSRE